MKSDEVLSKYKQGIRDFQKLDLKSQSFRGGNLQGADFSEANLQGTDFSEADLQGVNFSKANLQRAAFYKSNVGLQDSHKNTEIFKAIILSLVLIFVIPLSFTYLLNNYLTSAGNSSFKDLLCFSSVFLGFSFFAISFFGEGVKAALSVAGLSIISVLCSVFYEPAFILLHWILIILCLAILGNNLFKCRSMDFAFIIFSVVLLLGLDCFFRDGKIFIASIVEVESLNSIILFGSEIFFCVLASIGISVSITRLAIIFYNKNEVTNHNIIKASLWVLICVIVFYLFITGNIVKYINILEHIEPRQFSFIVVALLSGIYMAWGALKDNSKYVFIRDMSINLSFPKIFRPKGITSFRDADLSGACFCKAKMQLTDFRGAVLTHVNWYKAVNLFYARLGNSYLKTPQVRRLFLGKSGENKNFNHLNLSGIKLPLKTRLYNASFIGTNLTKSELKYANLENAKLVDCNLDGANLLYAKLTGACVENWRITKETIFDGVQCDFFYLRNPTPGNPNPMREPKNLNDKMDFKDFKNFCYRKFINYETSLIPVYESFSELYSISNKILREHRLVEKAKEAQINKNISIPFDIYSQMFKEYCRQRQENEWNSSWKSIFSRIERYIERLHRLTNEMDIFPILERLGQLSVIVAVIFFVNQNAKERIESQYRIWEVIKSENTLGGNITALENYVGHGGNLYNINANGAKLKDINLKNAKLRKAKLHNAELSQSFLYNADLKYAELPGAKLDYADLRNADLTEANLTGAEFIGADLRGIKTDEKTKFINADLRNANLTGTDLTNAKLTGADLRGIKTDGKTKFINAVLSDANLTGTDLTDANLTEAVLTGAVLTDANLTEAVLTGAVLTDANLTGADLTGADLHEAILIGANLTEAKFHDADFSDVKLSKTKLAKLDFSHINQLVKADFSRSDLFQAIFSKVNLSGANFSGANLSEANFSGANLSEANFSKANFSGANLSEANFTDEQVISGCLWSEATFFVDEQENSNYIEKLKDKSESDSEC